MTSRHAVFLFTLVLVSLLLTPLEAEACPVCFSAKEGSRQAFILTTALLTFLPLGMIGSLLFWLRKHLQKRDG